MVGIEKFKEYFKEFKANYVIIGGIARDHYMDDYGFTPKGTKDIDLILVVEALSAQFVKDFWNFIDDGKYQVKEKDRQDRKYYRFKSPEEKEFPAEIELFSRNPDLIDLDINAHLTPIPVNEGLTSLSAILLEDDYYSFILKHSEIEDGLHIAKREAIICLKARAFLDMTKLKEQGENIDSRKIKKHHSDIFRLALTLESGDVFDLPKLIENDLKEYLNKISDNLPNKQFYKSIGAGIINSEDVFNQLKSSFNVDD